MKNVLQRARILSALALALSALGCSFSPTARAQSENAVRSECTSTSKDTFNSADIVGSYSWSAKSTDASAEPGQKNYLTITALSGNLVHLHLATHERNGHDCLVEVDAALCGARMVFLPNQEDLGILKEKGMNPPRMKITTTKIEFIENSGGGFLSGPPYCGTMGYLRHSIPRSSRQTPVDRAILK